MYTMAGLLRSTTGTAASDSPASVHHHRESAMRIEVEVSRGHVFAQVGRWSLFLPLFSRQVWRLLGVSAGMTPQ